MWSFRKPNPDKPKFLEPEHQLPRKPSPRQPRTIKRLANSNQNNSELPTITIEDTSSKESKELDVDDGTIPFGPSPTPSARSSRSPFVKAQPTIQLYLNACKKFHLRPIKCIKSGLKKNKLACKYISLRSKDVEAIAVALMGNGYVEEIDFEYNDMGQDGAELLSEAVVETDYISHVRVAENKIGSLGARLLCRAVSLNYSIVSLDLSGNDFTEKDAVYFKALLEVSNTLEELYLGHNSFMEKGAILISKGLEKNKTLMVLDLSWNHIRMLGADAVGRALKHNRCLEKLNIAWNGLSVQGAKSLGGALKVNTTLKELDVQCNRMSEECLAEILKGLKNNTTLEILRLGQNHLTSAGAFTVLQHFKDIKTSAIKVLDFGNQSVHDKFEELLTDILQERDLQVVYGMVWHSDRKLLSANDVNEDVTFLLNSNPLAVIMECMRLQDFGLKDLFESLDTDKSSKICVDELVNGLLKINVPLRRDVLTQFLKKLDKDGDGELNYREMYEAQKIHKQQVRRLQEKNISLEETDIGRVSRHVRNIMAKSYIRKTTSLGDLSSRNSSPTPSLNSVCCDNGPRAVLHTYSPESKSCDSSPRFLSRDSSPLSFLHNISPRTCSRSCSPIYLSRDTSPNASCLRTSP